ncbi:Hypothetical predicted protein [Mytilus galloprovincialis]|uniref:Uncharacterized protein n=1 Tax=Mytilus galloprovincialis TaxID=29158 RepID=A0A8B6DXR7_MYTGA|nr:Hypothetical predicted protein [Mytilus galloprovincialis]
MAGAGFNLRSWSSNSAKLLELAKEEKQLTHPYKWRYCPTDNNPADLLTRGLTIEQFDQSILWRKGPNWLTDSTKWPELNSAKNTVLTSLVDDSESEEEIDNLDMTHQNSLGSITNILDISNHGSYMKLLRITAYVIRFIRNCRRDRISRKSGPLEVNEIQTAVNTWILDCQESTGNDGHVRAARIQTSNGETSRPIVKLFPLEVSGTHSNASSDHTDEQHEDTTQRSTRPKRNASIKAREKIRKWITNVDENDEED